MITPKRLVVGQALSIAPYTLPAALLYTVPVATTVVIKEIVLCNKDATVHFATLHIAPTNAPATVDDKSTSILHAMALQPGETRIIGMTNVMPAGYTIFGICETADVVAVNISGMLNT